MSAEIIVVDDDPLVGNLSHDILTDAGFQTKLIRDSRMAMGAIKENRPKLVILDILMPGIDGLTILHTIKNDAELKDTKVAVVSGKSFSAEIDRAKQYGAEMFIQKPYDVKDFANKVISLVGQPEGGKEAAKAESTSVLKIRVWGNSEEGSTSSVSIETKEEAFVFDAGKGVVAAGEDLLASGRTKAWLLLSHYHADHIGSLGLFPPLRSKGFELHIAGPPEPGNSLSAVLTQAIKESYKSNAEPIAAKVKLHELREETYEIRKGLRISPFYANHPSNTLGFHLEIAGRRIVFSPDSEIYGEAATALQDYDEKTGRIIRGADVLIHDARYKDEDYEAHQNEGHSGVGNIVGFAADNEIQRLVLWHLDPSYADPDLKSIEEHANKLLDEKGAVIPCDVARDGLTIEL